MDWIDTHCHLDAPEFAGDALALRARALAQGVRHCVIPAVTTAQFDAVRQLAHAGGDVYALGVHPLYTPQAPPDALARLDDALVRWRDDPRLVAVGEIGLDGFVPGMDMALQTHFYLAQLRLACREGLPVILHVRRSADRLLHGLREAAERHGRLPGGIAHAFNGSLQQAQSFVNLGFKLGFGGAVTFERALQLRRLVRALPLEALVLETDAPDMPPQWLYIAAHRRREGQPQGRNEPAQLPRIAAVVAGLRGMEPDELAQATTRNALAALPKLGVLALQPHSVAMGQKAGEKRTAAVDFQPANPKPDALPGGSI